MAALIECVNGIGAGDGVIIIDTLHAAMVGLDENAARDMGTAIAMAKQLRDATGCTVIVCHHSGKDGTRGERGHSSLRAAMDFSIEVARDTRDNTRTWNAGKVKDGPDGAEGIPFGLAVVEVGTDDEGYPITSCVAVPDTREPASPEAQEQRKGARLPKSGNQKIAVDAPAKPLRESPHFDKEGAPAGHPCLSWDDAVLIVAEALPVESKRKAERARDTIKAMVGSGIYGFKGGWLWRT